MNPTDQLVLEGLKLGIPAFVTLGVLLLTNWAFSRRQKADHRRDKLKVLDEKKEKLVEALIAYSKGFSNYVIEMENYFGGVGDLEELNSRAASGIKAQQAAEQTIEMLVRLYFPDRLREWEELAAFKKSINGNLRGLLVNERPRLPNEQGTRILASGEDYSTRTRGFIQTLIVQNPRPKK